MSKLNEMIALKPKAYNTKLMQIKLLSHFVHKHRQSIWLMFWDFDLKSYTVIHGDLLPKEKSVCEKGHSQFLKIPSCYHLNIQYACGQLTNLSARITIPLRQCIIITCFF